MDDGAGRSARKEGNQIGGALRQAPACRALLVLAQQAQGVEAAGAEDGESGGKRQGPGAYGSSEHPGSPPRAQQHERQHEPRRRLQSDRRPRDRAAGPLARVERSEHPRQRQQHDQRVVVRAADHVHQHERVEPDRQHREHRIAAELARAGSGERDHAQSGESGDGLQGPECSRNGELRKRVGE